MKNHCEESPAIDGSLRFVFATTDYRTQVRDGVSSLRVSFRRADHCRHAGRRTNENAAANWTAGDRYPHHCGGRSLVVRKPAFREAKTTRRFGRDASLIVKPLNSVAALVNTPLVDASITVCHLSRAYSFKNQKRFPLKVLRRSTWRKWGVIMQPEYNNAFGWFITESNKSRIHDFAKPSGRSNTLMEQPREKRCRRAADPCRIPAQPNCQ